MFSFLPMTTTAGHLNDPSGAVPRRKVVPSLGAVVLPPPPEGTPSSSSSSPSFAQNELPKQLIQRTDGTSPAGGGDAMSAGTFPHLQPFFAALARNLANISPQQQQTSQRCHAPNSVPPNSTNGAVLSSSPFCFGHPPNTFLARQPNAKQQQKHQQNSPPIVAEAQQQMMANWLNMLMMMNGGGNGNSSGTTPAGGGQSEGGAKTLESDSEGNSVCPACKEAIGKEPTEWESHLEAERSRLRGEIESLRAAVLAVQSIATSAAETTTAHLHNEQQRLGEAEIALERIRESQRHRVTAKTHGHFFMNSPILTMLIKSEDNSGRDNPKKAENEANEDGSGNGARQSANGFTVSPFSALELARGYKHKEEEEEGEKMTTKRMTVEGPEGMKRMSPEGMKRMSPEGTKRMSPEWMKRINTPGEEIKRPRMELRHIGATNQQN